MCGERLAPPDSYKHKIARQLALGGHIFIEDPEKIES